MSALRVVLQARTTSTRLPAKALLPIAGMPSAILAARRAARDGLDLVFATSTDPSDDLLAGLAASAGLKVFRGSKDDVLGRYAAATQDMDANDVVLRITGDDPVPDGDFLRALAAARAKRGVEMLFSMSPADGLPHGLAAQAFTVSALRAAAASATEPLDREHVGPWMVRNRSSAVFDELGALDLGHLRCTLDTIDDYFDLLRLFEGVADPVGVPWRALIDKLGAQCPWRGMPFRYLRGQPGGDGGVERLGALAPEIADQVDLDREVRVPLLRQAIRCGATHIVAEPGSAARSVGAALAQGWSGRANAILRLPPLPADVSRVRLGDWADATILSGLRDLGLARVHTVVVTPAAGARAAHLVEHIEGRRVQGWFRHLGVAVDSVAGAKRWLKHPGVVHIELACGPDERAPGLARILGERPEVMALARSRDATFQPTTVAGLLAQKWVHGVVVGIGEDTRHLGALVDAARAARPARK